MHYYNFKTQGSLVISIILIIISSTCFMPCFSMYREEPRPGQLPGNHGHHGYYKPVSRMNWFRRYHGPNNGYYYHHQQQQQQRGFLSGLVTTKGKSTTASPFTSQKLVSVNDYGAKGDGQSDDTQAFMKAWEKACAMERGVLVVPGKGVYRLKPIRFQGPCKSGFTVKIYGTIKASDNPADYNEDSKHWIMFENLDNFGIEGGGYVDGSGEKWWQKSCKINKNLPCKTAPTAMTFYQSSNLRIADITIKNAQQMHVLFQKCTNVQALNLVVNSPEESPNTDGIHVTETQNLLIKKSVIKTGDDCISIVSGSSHIQATDIQCGPGHGISIGSLGADHSEDYVSDVLINRATLSGTSNGVRIKTWQGGSGYAKNIRFQNIAMQDVENPIIIDQNYCDQDKKCAQQASAVRVSDILYQNIRGTSASDVAIKFDCSKHYPCQGVTLQDISLTTAQSKGSADASCVNVNYDQEGKVNPRCG